jgi:DNA-binding FrmR family transcriptional regulator
MEDFPQCGPSKYQRDNKDLYLRLKRIEGQIRGIQKMIEEDRYCIDIITQISAARAALKQVEAILLEGHLKGCVSNALISGKGDAAIQELLEVLKRNGV